MKEDIWFPVENYEGLYEINYDGKIRSLHKRSFHKIGNQRVDRAGYFTVRLSKGAKSSTHFVHRLLGLAFVPNPSDKAFINHKDSNKLNNDIDNLEWVSHAQNIKHAYTSGVVRSKAKTIIDDCTGREFTSSKEAANFYGIKYNTLRNYLNGRIATNPTCLRYKLVA